MGIMNTLKFHFVLILLIFSVQLKGREEGDSLKKIRHWVGPDVGYDIGEGGIGYNYNFNAVYLLTRKRVIIKASAGVSPWTEFKEIYRFSLSAGWQFRMYKNVSFYLIWGERYIIASEPVISLDQGFFKPRFVGCPEIGFNFLTKNKMTLVHFSYTFRAETYWGPYGRHLETELIHGFNLGLVIKT